MGLFRDKYQKDREAKNDREEAENIGQKILERYYVMSGLANQCIAQGGVEIDTGTPGNSAKCSILTDNNKEVIGCQNVGSSCGEYVFKYGTNENGENLFRYYHISLNQDLLGTHNPNETTLGTFDVLYNSYDSMGNIVTPYNAKIKFAMKGGVINKITPLAKGDVSSLNPDVKDVKLLPDNTHLYYMVREFARSQGFVLHDMEDSPELR